MLMYGKNHNIVISIQLKLILKKKNHCFSNVKCEPREIMNQETSDTKRIQDSVFPANQHVNTTQDT